MPAAPAKPTPPAVRARIIAAARQHFLAHGFRGVTMDDLAAEIGMSKKTFYAHFTSKGELLEAVLDQKLSDVEADLERISTDPGAPFSSALSTALACLHRHTGEIQPVFLRDIRRDAPGVFSMVEARRAKIIARTFSRLFSQGRKAGMIRRDIPLNLLLEVLLAASSAIMNPQKLDALRLSPRAGYAAILEIILHGAMNPQPTRES